MGLDLPYDVLKRKKVNLTWHDTYYCCNRDYFAVDYEIDIGSTINSFRISYEDWLLRHNYDVEKVKILSALIQLNMAPLHPNPMGDTLFCHANLRLAQLLVPPIFP
jgi:hypothetical protein